MDNGPLVLEQISEVCDGPGTVYPIFKLCYLETCALCRIRVWQSRLGSLRGARTLICSTELHSFRIPTYRPGWAH